MAMALLRRSHQASEPLHDASRLQLRCLLTSILTVLNMGAMGTAGLVANSRAGLATLSAHVHQKQRLDDLLRNSQGSLFFFESPDLG